ncbi:MAG: GIY-YIG nuclease family protein [Bacteroidota bacterium]
MRCFFLCQNFIYIPFIVYIIFSSTKDKFYIGLTSDLEEKIIRHNQRSKGFTGNTNDWKIVYTENYSTKTEALAREKQIKSWKSRIKIQELISNKD